MKVLHVGKYYAPSHGGMETILRSLAEGTHRAGDQVTVLCASENGAGTEEWVHGVRVIRAAQLGKLLSQPLTPTLPVHLARLAREADVVNLHSPNPLSEAALLALPDRIPLVISHHSDVVRQRALLPFYGPLLHRLLKRARRIVVATENHIVHSSFLPAYGEKCRVIPYGLDPAPFQATPAIRAEADALRAELGEFVLFVGRLVGYKGAQYLIAAMRDIDARLVLIGQGPLRAELEARTRELGLTEKVRFAGAVDSMESLVAHYHACGVFVLPSISKTEAFGLVQLEAMACGKPTVASRLDSGITLVGQEGVTGLLVEPESPTALARAVRELLADPARRQRMGEAARARFEAVFSQRKLVESYRALYAEVIAS